MSKILDEPSDDSDRPEFMKHQRIKLKVLIRRGSAYCKLAMFPEARADYGIAVSMDTQNEILKEDFHSVIILQEGTNYKQDCLRLIENSVQV